MSDTRNWPAECYVRAMHGTIRFIDEVRDDQWGNPTPCSEWSVRDIVNHITVDNLWVPDMIAGKTMDEVGDRFDGDVLGTDPKAAYRSSLADAERAIMSAGAMDRICHLPFGDFTGFRYAQEMFLDALIHGWDIAQSSGQEVTLDRELVDACYPIAEAFAEIWRQVGEIGPDRRAKDMDAQANLLALLGRQATWADLAS